MYSSRFQNVSIAIILLMIFSLFLNCSSNPTNNEPDNTEPKTLTVTPSHATPGVTLSVGGFTIDTTKITEYTIYIGGQQSFLISDSSGGVSTIAPGFFKDSTSTWPSPSVGALDIEIFKDSVLVARGVSIFTSDSLIQVPGSTQKLVTNIISTVESYKSILEVLPSGPGIQEQLSVAMITALDSLLYGRGDSSLSALLSDLQTNNPDALALLDAIYGSGGSVDRSQEIADAMEAIALSFNSGSLKSSQALPADVKLAAQMQLSSLLKLFGDSFIHGASSTSSDIAFGTSWLRFAGFIPGARIIIAFAGVTSTVLSMVDLIFNKIMVASMPTVIDSFTITFSIDTINVGDTTVSSLKVFARNSPPQITLADLLSQLSGILGLLGPSNPPTMLQQLEGTLNYILGQANNALQAYGDSHPVYSYEPIFFNIAGIPIIHWEAEITDPRLLDLRTFSSRLAVINSLVEWRSTGDPGSASVTISPSFGEDATIINIPSFLGYVGSSFGVLSDSSALISETKEITILSRLALEVDFATTISSDGANVLGVRAGTISLAGDTNWTSGLNVTLTAIGGGADPSTGTTDANGLFNSLVSLDPFSDTVIVDVRVTGTFGGIASTEVMAINQPHTSSVSFISNSSHLNFRSLITNLNGSILCDSSITQTAIDSVFINETWTVNPQCQTTVDGCVFSNTNSVGTLQFIYITDPQTGNINSIRFIGTHSGEDRTDQGCSGANIAGIGRSIPSVSINIGTTTNVQISGTLVPSTEVSHTLNVYATDILTWFSFEHPGTTIINDTVTIAPGVYQIEIDMSGIDGNFDLEFNFSN